MIKIRLFLMTSSILVATSSFLHAEDVMVQAHKPAVQSAASKSYNWTGVFTGAHAAYTVAGHSNLTGGEGAFFPGPADNTGTASFGQRGALFGTGMGFNIQSSQLVFGGEADIDYSSVSGTMSGVGTESYSGNLKLKMDWIGTLRGRLGLAFDRILLFGTGGLAYANTKSSGQVFESGSPVGSISGSHGVAGWTAGGGVEYAIDEHFSVKAEDLYMKFNSVNITGDLPGAGPVEERPLVVKTNLDILRFGLNYRF